MTPTILVLEDDESLREMIVEILEEHEYIAHGAGDCDRALALADQMPIDLAISDVRMAGRLDGLGTMEVLKGRNRKMGCIIITGYASETAVTRAARIQADDYLYKPIQLLELLQMVNRVLSKQREKTGYLQLLRKVLATPQKMLDGQKRDALVEQLEAIREEVLQAYYLKIRGRDQHLTKSAARDLWDELEQLDLQYQLTANWLRQFSPSVLQAMLDQYKQIQQNLLEVSQTQALGSLKARGEEQVERATFFRFFGRIESGAVSCEQLKVAAAIRRLQTSRPSPEVNEIYQKIWG